MGEVAKRRSFRSTIPGLRGTQLRAVDAGVGAHANSDDPNAAVADVQADEHDLGGDVNRFELVEGALSDGVAPPQAWASTRASRRRRQRARTVLMDVTMLLTANLLIVASNSGDVFAWPYLILFNAVVVGYTAARRGYAPRLRRDTLDDVRRSVLTTLLATMAVLSVYSVAASSMDLRAADALSLWAATTALLVLGRAGATAESARRHDGAPGARTIIVGAGEVGRLAASRLLEHSDLGLHPVGFLDADPFAHDDTPSSLPVLGTNADLASIVADRDVEFVVIAFSNASHEEFLELLDECDRLGIRALVVPRLFERVPSRLRVTHVGGLPLLEMLPTSPRSFQFAIKYVFDRIAATVLLITLAPLLATIAVVVAVSLGRPLLYRQNRVSIDGRDFRMLKFRTMQAAAEDDPARAEFDPVVAPGGVEGRDRRTRAGSFLRSWSLDELPQLVNVLKGEMSMVGPRPERPEYVEYFRKHVRRYDGRLRTKAGITGWAQIHRLRGQTSITDRVEWDNYYIENFSLWLDLKSLVRTIPTALRGDAD